MHNMIVVSTPLHIKGMMVEDREPFNPSQFHPLSMAFEGLLYNIHPINSILPMHPITIHPPDTNIKIINFPPFQQVTLSPSRRIQYTITTPIQNHKNAL